MRTYLLTDEMQAIARAGEGDISIAVNVTDWLTEYPDGVGAILCTRPDGQPVPVDATVSDNLMIAELPSTCLSRPGVYSYLATWTEAGTLRESQVYRTMVLATGDGREVYTDGSLGEPSWATEIFVRAEQIDVALDSALQLAQYAVDAETARDEAAGYASDASEAKDDAVSAKGDAEDAQEAAENARDAAILAAANASAAYGTDLLADDYSSSATYSVGDYVIYSGDLYRCTTAITTAEAWTAGHWAQVQVGTEVGDLKSAVESYPSHNLASFNYREYDGIYPSTAKLNVTNLDTGVRLAAPNAITASRYIYFMLPISDFYGETLYFSATVTKGTDSVKPRFACRYWDGTTATAIVNSGTTASLEINVVDQETAVTNGYTYLRFEFYITYTSASIVEGDYVDYTNVSIERKRHLSAYSYPDNIVKNSVVGKNQKRYIVDATTELYFESYNNGIYFKFSGSLYMRGLLPYTTLRISYTGSSASVRTFDDAYEIVESNAGVTGCIYIPNNYCAVYDFANDKIVSLNFEDLDAGMFVIFAVSSGIVTGGEGKYIYDHYIVSNEMAKLQNVQLNDDWADDVQPVQIEQKKAFVFGVQTDTHYDPLKTYFTDGSHSGDDYAKQLAIFSRYVGMDFICNLGDIICGYAVNTQTDSREAMTDIVNRYVAESKCPVLFAVGNHDDGVLYTTSNGTQNYSIDEIITGAELYGRIGVPMYNTGDFVHGKELYYYIDFDDVRVIMLNTRDNVYDGVVGSDNPDADVSINAHRIRSTQLAWFRNVLENSTDKKIIVMSHVGLVDGVRTDTYGVSNADEVVSALESFRTGGGTVIGAFSGHAHAQISTIVNGINYIGFDDGGKFAEIVMVDTDAKTIKTKMVGDIPSGDVDREFSYT